MAATPETKYQVNFKSGDALINIYATTAEELEAQLTVLQDTAELIKTTAVALGGSAPVANVAYAAQAFGGTVEQSAPAFNQPTSFPEGSCKHGALVWRESKPGAPKPWKGWFCPSPKGTPDQCEPKFVR
jgi:hypothetical protein